MHGNQGTWAAPEEQMNGNFATPRTQADLPGGIDAASLCAVIES
jgi:hypothetical protein